GRRFSVFATEIGNADYQVVAVISYTDATRGQPVSLLGYVVNLAWAREHYFQELVDQVAAIEGTDHSVRFSILDDHSKAVVGASSPQEADTPVASRIFPVAFFDPSAVAVDPPADLNMIWWTAVTTAKGDPTLAAAESGARRTLGIAAVMTLTLAAAV